MGRTARIVTSGILWAAVYNAVWAAAWFAFMRAEWQSAFRAVGQPMLWASTVWIIWAIVTVPLGIAIATYAADRSPGFYAWLLASVLLWTIVAGGSDIAFVQMSVPLRTIVLDTLVNLLGMGGAAFAACYRIGRIGQEGDQA